MPKQICHTCLNRLDSAYDLFKMCESVQDGIQRKVASQAQINGDVHLLEVRYILFTIIINKWEDGDESSYRDTFFKLLALILLIILSNI